MFFDARKYDFSRVGRLKFNTKLKLTTPLDEKILHPQDFYDVIKYLLQAAARTRRRRRHRSPRQPPRALGRRAAREPVPHRPGAHGARDQGEDVGLPGNGDRHAARPDQRQAGDGGDPRVLRLVAAVAVHGPDQPALGDHAQAASLGARTGRSVARARRVRGARRAPDALRPHLPDRDAGRPEHRSDLVAVVLRADQRVRLHREAVPQGEERPRDRLRAASRTPATAKFKVGEHRRTATRSRRETGTLKKKKARLEFEPYPLLPVGVGRGQVHHRAGQRRRSTRTGICIDERVNARAGRRLHPGAARRGRSTSTSPRSSSSRWRRRSSRSSRTTTPTAR